MTEKKRSTPAIWNDPEGRWGQVLQYDISRFRAQQIGQVTQGLRRSISSMHSFFISGLVIEKPPWANHGRLRWGRFFSKRSVLSSSNL